MHKVPQNVRFFSGACMAIIWLNSCHETHAADIDQTIYLPCPSYTEGSIWYFEENGPGPDEFSTNVTAVVSNYEGKITLVKKVTSVSSYMPTQSFTIPQQVEFFGNTLYEVRNNLPHVDQLPLCGELPVRRQFQIGKDKDTPLQETVTAKAVRRELVTVPAGTFDAFVVEITTNTELGDTYTNTKTETVYAAEKVGIVRYIRHEKMGGEKVGDLTKHMEHLEKFWDNITSRKVIGELRRYRIK